MCVTDSWKTYKHHLPNKAKDKQITVKRYANILALSLLNNNYSTVSSDDTHLYIPTVEDDKDTSLPLNSVLECSGSIESISCVTDNVPPPATHPNPSTVPHKRARATRNTKILTRSGERNKGDREVRLARKR